MKNATKPQQLYPYVGNNSSILQESADQHLCQCYKNDHHHTTSKLKRKNRKSQSSTLLLPSTSSEHNKQPFHSFFGVVPTPNQKKSFDTIRKKKTTWSDTTSSILSIMLVCMMAHVLTNQSTCFVSCFMGQSSRIVRPSCFVEKGKQISCKSFDRKSQPRMPFQTSSSSTAIWQTPPNGESANYSNSTDATTVTDMTAPEIATAPEVNQWTTIMADGTNAAIEIKQQEQQQQQQQHQQNEQNIDKSPINVSGLGFAKPSQASFSPKVVQSSYSSSISNPNQADAAPKRDFETLSKKDEKQLDEYWKNLYPKLHYLQTKSDTSQSSNPWDATTTTTTTTKLASTTTSATATTPATTTATTNSDIHTNYDNDGSTSIQLIKQALRVAYCAHSGQYRKSGEPFIIHPIEVSMLLAELQMDADTVMAGLLHDTVEDTELTFDQVEQMFGYVVKSIVEGETKVSKLPKLAFQDYADEQAENLRQMFVAMTDDYRIIIVKLADRLHNMRTLRFMKPEKQIKISRETLDIFAPLAHRMGIWQFKAELEDTSFMYLYPREYKRLNRRLRRNQSKFRDTLDKSVEILQRTLDNDDMLREKAQDVQVYGRRKELYSLWYKMEAQDERNLDHVIDVVGLRVVIDPANVEGKVNGANGIDGNSEGNDNETDRGVWLCYHVLGLVQHLPGFKPVPTKVKDYISFPKPNGYQSLHTEIMWKGQTIEVQIRTTAMHKVAEYGMASHWAYTDAKKRSLSGSESLYNTPWLSSIKEWQDEVLCSRDFVDCVRRELLGKRVFVFLRNGKILNLAKGATVIDAAFQIHSEVGLNMHGVEINGRSVPFSYELQNGDVVSVLTGNGKPATDWMKFAKSRSTRSKLRSYFSRQQRESLRDAGKMLFMDYLSAHRKIIAKSSYLETKFIVPVSVENLKAFLPGKTQYHDVDDLLVDIGKSDSNEFLRKVIAKIFLVPKSMLLKSEEGRIASPKSDEFRSVVEEMRQSALDAGAVLNASVDTFELDEVDSSNSMKEKKNQKNSKINSNSEASIVNSNGLITTDQRLSNGKSDPSMNAQTDKVEVANPENLCSCCLPVLGDEIIGTRPHGATNDFQTTVHRHGCPIAQKVYNSSGSTNYNLSNTGSDSDSKSNNDIKLNGMKLRKTSSLRSRLKRRLIGRNSSGKKSLGVKFKREAPQEIVPLKWGEVTTDVIGNSLYLAEISIIANDRKLLLADCSEVVSDMSEIVKTGSLSTKENAVLEFLIKIESLQHLQNLMDSLREIPSVMSVERKFGSTM